MLRRADSHEAPQAFGLVSTFGDLDLERERTAAVLVDQRRQVLSLRDGARCLTSAEVCRKEMRQCDAVIVLLAYRYGTLVGGVSYTEMEIDEALRQHKPILAYAICPLRGKKAGVHFEEGSQAQRARLRQKLERFVKLGTFENAEDLARRVASDLPRLDRDYQCYTSDAWHFQQFLVGNLDSEATLTVAIDVIKPTERAPTEVAEVLGLSDLQRSFCSVNGEGSVWVYFYEEWIGRAIDWSCGTIANVVCKPLFIGHRQGLLISDVLTPCPSGIVTPSAVTPPVLRVVKSSRR